MNIQSTTWILIKIITRIHFLVHYFRHLVMNTFNIVLLRNNERYKKKRKHYNYLLWLHVLWQQEGLNVLFVFFSLPKIDFSERVDFASSFGQIIVYETWTTAIFLPMSLGVRRPARVLLAIIINCSGHFNSKPQNSSLYDALIDTTAIVSAFCFVLIL